MSVQIDIGDTSLYLQLIAYLWFLVMDMALLSSAMSLRILSMNLLTMINGFARPKPSKAQRQMERMMRIAE